MKWHKKTYRNGDTRIIKKFLWSPMCLDDKEVRWLEFVYIKQKFHIPSILPFHSHWENLEFVK